MDIDNRLMNKYDRMLHYVKQGGHDPELEEQWERWNITYSLLKKASKSNVAKLLMKKYAVNRSMAYLIIRETETFWGKHYQYDRDFLRAMTIENILMDIQLAREKGDYKAIGTLYRSLAEWSGIKDLENELDAEKMIPHLFSLDLKLNDKELPLPLDALFKLSDEHRRAISDLVAADDVSWDEVEEVIEHDKKKFQSQ